MVINLKMMRLKRTYLAKEGSALFTRPTSFFISTSISPRKEAPYLPGQSLFLLVRDRYSGRLRLYLPNFIAKLVSSKENNS